MIAGDGGHRRPGCPELKDMLLLNYISLLAIGLWLPLNQDQDLSLLVQRAVPPTPPQDTYATGVMVAEIEIDRTTGELSTRILYGDSPFVPPALNALKHWGFIAPPEVLRSRTSVTFLFRPPAFYSVNVGTLSVRPWMPGEDCAALPQNIVDPGYPAASLATGAVVLEVRLNAAGSVTGVKTVIGITPLTEQAVKAVKKWQFSPAMISGKPVSSTAFVVISFVLPT